MKLENIGFYTLSHHRAVNASAKSPMWRCELLLLDQCNFRCSYCRGLRQDCAGIMNKDVASQVLECWIQDGLQHIRFSGGEPTLYPYLSDLVYQCRRAKVKRVAISTNGSADFDFYKSLVTCGVNDFSISLDACCAGKCKTMSGVDMFGKISDNIRKLSKLTYVTVGIVITKDNANTLQKTIEYASNLGVADIRIIPAAQNSSLKMQVAGLNNSLLSKHPILKYRVNRFLSSLPVRGLQSSDAKRCRLLYDDSVVAGKWHFPCVIYLREGGKPIGEIRPNMRQERIQWLNKTDTYNEDICRKNCLDVCVAYNNYLYEE